MMPQGISDYPSEDADPVLTWSCSAKTALLGWISNPAAFQMGLEPTNPSLGEDANPRSSD